MELDQFFRNAWNYRNVRAGRKPIGRRGNLSSGQPPITVPAFQILCLRSSLFVSVDDTISMDRVKAFVE